jgi:hypothetical protein
MKSAGDDDSIARALGLLELIIMLQFVDILSWHVPSPDSC